MVAIGVCSAWLGTTQASIIAIDDFSSASSLLDLSGSARIIGDPGYLELTQDGHAGQAGSAYLKTPLNYKPTIGFTATFRFQILHNGGRASEADGLVFLILPQNPEVHPLGDPGGNLGYLYNGLTPIILPHYAIEFDTHLNPALGDPSNEHIALTRFSPGIVSATTTLASSDAIFADGLEHEVVVEAGRNGSSLLRVFLDDQLALSFDFSHERGLNDPSLGQPGFGHRFATGFGFSAATGVGTATHRINSWLLSVPLPATSWLLGLGLVALRIQAPSR